MCEVYSDEWFNRLKAISPSQANHSKLMFSLGGKKACVVCGDESTTFGQTDFGLNYQFCLVCGLIQAAA
jgi:hypothetical protein